MRFRLLTPTLLLLLFVPYSQTVTAQGKKGVVPPASPVQLENSAPVVKGTADAAGIEYFEKSIRPVLVQQCYACHSHAAKKSLGNLYLDSRAGILQGGQRGPAMVPGHPDKSLLLEAVRYTQPTLQMPMNKKLPEKVIAVLAEWVKMGAPWPEERAPGNVTVTKNTSLIEKQKRQHWAWQPVRNPRPPVVNRKGWAKNPIDQFLLAKMEAKGLTPNTYADRRTLIRRATFDLIGLPPTPEEVKAFLADKSPNAWEKVINRLLASPHYGERWGRFWLDIARYGEDQAHSFEPRLYPQGFRYRDWVAKALNSDMPYDRFVRLQIAADLMKEPDAQEHLPALGFFAMGPVYYGDVKMFDQYDDRIDTLSRGFLGLTVACSRCHDHKFDPISQKDYYALAGVFANSHYVEIAVNSPEAQGKDGKSGGMVNRAELINAKAAEVDKFTQEHVGHLRERLTPEIARYLLAVWKLQNRRKADAKVTVEQVAAKEGIESIVLERWTHYLADATTKDRSYLADWRQLIQKEEAKSDLSASETAISQARKVAEEFQNYLLTLRKRKTDREKDPKTKSAPLEKTETVALEEIFGGEGVLTLPADQFHKLLVGDDKVHYATIKSALDRLKMGSFVHALTESPKIANLPVLQRGNPETPGEEAPRRFLTLLAGENAPLFKQGSGRLELANAITDKKNPLTVRVMVNRIWQHHFGVGLVRTASNFGLLGEKPTHPELLDYLATQFIAQGWSQKALHRQIMLSATYQMSSASKPHNYEIDPDNRMLWRVPRRRLEVEAWRDAMLAVSDKLDRTIGGASVSLSSPENNRRTFYASISRHDLDAMLRLFDFPDPNATTDARTATTVPLQQLFVLNSEFMVQQAKAFAARLTSVADESDATRIRRAYLLVNSRPPTERELALGLSFLQGPKTVSAIRTTTLVAGNPPANDKPASRLSRWEQYAQALLCANEFMYVD